MKFDQLAYTCLQCGRSCTGWNIWLDESTRDRIKELPMTLRVIEERGQAFEEQEGKLKMRRLQDADPCGFLNERKLCDIHAELGMTAKPVGCQQFPFLVTRLPGGELRVSASFCCTAVRSGQGPSLEQSRSDVESVLSQGGLVTEIEEFMEVAPGFPVGYPEIAAWEEGKAPDSLDWEAVLGGVARGRLTPDEPIPGLGWFRQVLILSLFKLCLYDPDRELWKRIDQGFLGECELVVPEYRWSAPVTELDSWVSQSVGSEYEAEIARYLRSLWFRKAHLSLGSLLAGLIMVWALPDLLRILAALFAHRRQVHRAEPQDFGGALDLVEMSLLAHSRNGALAVQQLSHHLVAMAQS